MRATALSRRNGRRGITVLELVTAMTITGIVSTGVIAVYIFANLMFADIGSFDICHQNARQSLDILSKDLRSAAEVVDAYGGYSTSTHTLVLKLPAIDAGYVPLDIDSRFDYIIYHPDPTNPDRFMRTTVADPDSSRLSGTQQVKFGVRAISFQGWYAAEPDALGTHVLHVQLVTRRTTPRKTTEMPLSVSIKLRNKGY